MPDLAGVLPQWAVRSQEERRVEEIRQTSMAAELARPPELLSMRTSPAANDSGEDPNNSLVLVRPRVVGKRPFSRFSSISSLIFTSICLIFLLLSD